MAAGGDWLELDWGGGGGRAGRVAAVWVRDNSRHPGSYDASARARTLLMADTEVEVKLVKVGPVQCHGSAVSRRRSGAIWPPANMTTFQIILSYQNITFHIYLNPTGLRLKSCTSI